MKRLNVFVDETGEFGFGNKSSKLYGISFTFHNQDDNIKDEINNLNERLKRIGYNGMIHMADLIMKRGEYSQYSIKMRKDIFNVINLFSQKIPVKFCTIIVDKKYTDNLKILKRKIYNEIYKMIKNNSRYFNKFNEIVLYYDNGQDELGKIIDKVFKNNFNNYQHIAKFNHVEKRLFQVADMLTYIDKYDYKYKNKKAFTKSEKYFFKKDEIRKVLKELNKKRLNH